MNEENQKGVKNMAEAYEAYDNINVAEGFSRNSPPANMFDRIRDKEFQTTFSNLNLKTVGINTGFNPFESSVCSPGGIYNE